MSNQWMITEDKINGGEYNGYKSPGFKTDVKMPVKFKMYGDDMILYFEGVMEREDFHPMYNFGLPGFGCTEMKCNSGQGWQAV